VSAEPVCRTRGTVLPLVHRIDLSVARTCSSTSEHEAAVPDPARHAELRQPAQQRLGRCPAPDQRPAADDIRLPVDAQGRATYRMRVVNNQLMNKSYEQTADTSDVYRFLISLKYFFN